LYLWQVSTQIIIPRVSEYIHGTVYPIRARDSILFAEILDGSGAKNSPLVLLKRTSLRHTDSIRHQFSTKMFA